MIHLEHEITSSGVAVRAVERHGDALTVHAETFIVIPQLAPEVDGLVVEGLPDEKIEAIVRDIDRKAHRSAIAGVVAGAAAAGILLATGLPGVVVAIGTMAAAKAGGWLWVRRYL